MSRKSKSAVASGQAMQRTSLSLGAHDRPTPKKAHARTHVPQSWWYALAFLAFVGVGVAGIVLVPKYLFAPTKKSESASDYVSVKDRPAPKLNDTTAPGPAPDGMVWVPGGEFYMGIDIESVPDHLPLKYAANLYADALHVHKVYVDGFWMDKTEVTNEQFKKFVDATKYVTIAERPPDPRDFPGVPADKIEKEPFSIVFKKPLPGKAWWHAVKGACWKHPEGPGSTIAGKETHPVVHIAWDDAVEYCKWAKKRLPTEAEWEFAARGGLDREFYAWGDELNPGGKWMCNNWQGKFPVHNELLDGYLTTAPVGSYPANGYGLVDMMGNVWEWCADYYQPKYYEESPQRNPRGPISGWDPQESGVAKRVQRGGSFLCADSYCLRYIPGARGKGEPKSAAMHVGFRCVRDLVSHEAS